MILKVQGDEVPFFYAGQYINVLLPDGQKRSFSFATAPHERDHIELQVRWIQGGLFTTRVFTEMKEGDTLQFEGPLGSFFLREDNEKPIIFVAGATGFAPVKSMVEHAFHIGLKRRMYLYWGVRSLRDLYLADLPRQWEREHATFKFVPVLSEPQPEDNWSGRTGFVHEAILADFPDLSNHQIYACGSVGDGPGGASRVHGARHVRARLLLGCLHARAAVREGDRGDGAAGGRAMNTVARYAVQGVLYGAFVAAVGYFSSAPAFRHMPPVEALVRLSFSHAAQRVQPCRERTAGGAREACAQHAGTARLPARARRRDRGAGDGREAALRIVAAPAGLDVTARRPCTGGSWSPPAATSSWHASPTRARGSSTTPRRSVELAPGRVLLIDFNAGRAALSSAAEAPPPLDFLPPARYNQTSGSKNREPALPASPQSLTCERKVPWRIT